MQSQAHSRYLPNTERLSVLAATILLAYALTRFVTLPGWELTARPLGILVSFHVNVQTIIPLLVAGLMAAGTSWLLSDHPALRTPASGSGRRSQTEHTGRTPASGSGRRSQTERTGRTPAEGGRRSQTEPIMPDQAQRGPGPEHWLLPAVVAWVISIPLAQLPAGPLWVLGLAIGGGLLVVILTAEYIAIDADDLRQPIAEAVLTAVSFAAYLLLAIALRAAETRLYLILPALAITASVISLRTWHLRLGGEWAWIEAGLVLVIVGQVAAALHYWPLPALSYGLAVLGPAYAMTNLVTSMAQGATFRQALAGPLVMLALTWGAAWWIR
jgi:hypothetical protein